MSDIQHIDVDAPEFEDAPKALRDHVKKLQAANTTLKSDLGQTRTQLNSRVLGDVLKDKGFKNPSKVSRDLLADGIDPLDQGAVNAWLTENENDYARGAAAPESNPVNDERAQQHAQIQQVVATGTPTDGTAFARAQAEIAAIPNPTGQQIDAIYRKHGV